MIKQDKCIICGNTQFRNLVSEYKYCISCGHETFENNETQGFIINDLLDVEEIKKLRAVDKFKIKILKKCRKKSGNILDIGSASGKFLYHVKNLFHNYSGLEITPECIDFSINKLHLNIIQNIKELNISKIENATFWHSLEHIPIKEIEKILKVLEEKSFSETILIISVPNNESFQYRLFKKKYPYYDCPNHLHQFSIKSLSMLLNKYGFEVKKNFFLFHIHYLVTYKVF